MSEIALDGARRAASWGRARGAWPFLGVLVAALALPLLREDYWTVIATRAAIYWVLVSGLNLVVGFAGQLAIGYVALLTLGAYTASVLVERAGVSPGAGLLAAGVVGAISGVFVGLPALRLRTFYFAMTTLGFATIVTQVALAWTGVTGGGIGLPGPSFAAPFDGANGFYLLCVAIAAVCTWMTLNVAASRFGRGLVALRDAEVAAEASGVRKAPLLLSVFLVSGALAGVAGALFASLQSYITPDAFTFDLSVLFFIAILIGGRGSVLGPLLATLLLTVLPEFAAPLVAWSTFLYAALLLVIVLLAPGGLAALLDRGSRRPLAAGREILPRVGLVAGLLARGAGVLTLRGVGLSFGAVRGDCGAGFGVAGGGGAWADWAEWERQDDDAECDLRVQCAAGGECGGGWSGLGAGGCGCAGGGGGGADVPDAADRGGGERAGERDCGGRDFGAGDDGRGAVHAAAEPGG